MAKVVDAQGQASSDEDDLSYGNQAPRPSQKEESQAQLKKGIPDRIASLAVATMKAIKDLREDRNQIQRTQTSLTGIAVTSWSDNGLLWKTVNDQTKKGSENAPDKKKININHTYLFVKNRRSSIMEKHKQDSEVKMTIRFEEKVSTENAQLACQWSNSLGKSFQEQWMGPMIPFPLTIQVLQDLEGIFSIFDGQEFVGLIQKIRLEDRNLHIGRFFINPQKQGQRLGSQALRKFVSLAFENEDIDTISLNVFESNQAAKHLYQKEGFEIVKTIEAPVRKYLMKKFR